MSGIKFKIGVLFCSFMLISGCNQDVSEEVIFVENNDPSFGADGSGKLNIVPPHEDSKPVVLVNAVGVTTDAQSSVYIAGEYESGRRLGFLMKLTEAGKVDASCKGGFIPLDFGTTSGMAAAIDVKLDSQQNALVSGTGLGATIVRLTPQCAIDKSWGVNGAWLSQYGAPNKVVRMAVNPVDGSVAGILWTATRTKMNIVKVDRFGNSDKAFAGGGLTTLPVEPSGILYGLAFDSQQRLVIVGSADRIGRENRLTVYRLLPNGVADSSFGQNGQVTLDLGDTVVGNDVAFQIDGKIVVGGTLGVGYKASGFVLRLNADGSVDTQFGNAGVSSFKYRADFPTGIYSVRVQHNGQIVAAGTNILPHTANGVTTQQGVFALFRLQSNGALDGGYGDGGKVAAFIPPAGGEGWRMELDAKGRYVMIGNASEGFGVARILP